MGRDAWREPERSLVRICDLAGRPRGHGFAADDHGTVVTSHEAVDGLARIVLHAPGERTCVVAADAVTALPESDLALVRTHGLDLRPLPVTARDSVDVGSYVRIATGGWRQARVLDSAAVTYTATDRFHLIDAAMELAIGTDGADALRLGGGAAGGPVVDAASGAVLAVLATALQAPHRAAGFAVPLRAAAAADPDGPLAALLARNAATVPGFGPDLNLAGALHLTATSLGSDGPRALDPAPVERPETCREFTRFAAGPARVLGLVGDPGTGRTTELAALARRRARGAEPAPTLWLRGADLRDADTSVADAVGRALERAGRILAASDAAAGGDDGLGDISAGRVARLVREAGRPLLLLLDGPEEMPPVLAHRLAGWSTGTAGWLRDTGARLVVACRAEYWEQAGAHFPPELLHVPEGAATADRSRAPLPGCVRIGELPEPQARRARERYGVADGALADAEAGHPLTLRLLSEVTAALPDAAPAGRPCREEVFAAHLDLLCLRVAVRLAADSGLRGTAVRRLAAKVSGQVHEAARRCLGPGQGQLDRRAFETVFPWGALPGKGAPTCTGWASAVLTEGILVPAGSGYRFAHEEVGDWLQGLHLDVDAALTSLILRHAHPHAPPRSLPVPRHRAGPVLQALLGLERQRGTEELAVRLGELVGALEVFGGMGEAGADGVVGVPSGVVGGAGVLVEEAGAAGGAGVLVEEAGAQRGAGVLGGRGDVAVCGERVGPDCAGVPQPRVGGWGGRRGAAARGGGAGAGAAGGAVGAEGAAPGAPDSAHPAQGRSGAEAGGGVGPEVTADVGSARWWARHLVRETLLRVADATPYRAVLQRLAAQRQFGPDFWLALPLSEAARFELLRAVVVHDGPPGTGRRCLDAVAERLAADPAAVQHHLTRWFADERPLRAAPEATVASAAQALLHTHRHRAVDDLTEALVDCTHPRADELLGALAEDEPSALCRAVDRWAHDARPARRVAAATHAPRAARHTTGEADRRLLRYAAQTLLERPGDEALHGAALALLVRDPHSRARHLPHALRLFATGDPGLPASALATALTTHPEPVLAAFRDRLRARDTGTAEVLRGLRDVPSPALARRVADLVRERVEQCPRAAGDAAAHVDLRLEHGPEVRAELFPLVVALLKGRGADVRVALAPVLAAPGTPVSRPLRTELLDLLLAAEREPAVFDAVLRAVGGRGGGAERDRDLVRRTALLAVRTPEGATAFDRALVDVARRVPGFAMRLMGWLADAPQDWAALVGPSARRTIEHLTGEVPVSA
ncbi:serine protease [Streptomyces flavofungini]|nr:serine protease [Streptomyces flavofungini]WJV45829.1 serine protease [Streptomyces flavofungini]